MPAANVHDTAVDCLVRWGVAFGESTTGYHPDIAVNREQMASFIARLIVNTGGTLPADPADAFRDDDTSSHEANTDALAAVGVVHGTAPGLDSPVAPVTRAQIATYLIRAYQYRTDGDCRVHRRHRRDELRARPGRPP